GFVPNLYATMAHSENALGNFLTASGAKSSLNNKEKEVINLVVSQVNDCRYCQSAHTAIGKMNGFTDEQILEIRQGTASFDTKLDALAKFTYNASVNRGKPSQAVTDALLATGYTKENVVDIVLIISEITVTNYLHGITQIPIDFPIAPELELSLA
ncbi:MAG: carboxymuconolactone decarboxylase family protein, partial [Bacteroidota bacterium]